MVAVLLPGDEKWDNDRDQNENRHSYHVVPVQAEFFCLDLAKPVLHNIMLISWESCLVYHEQSQDMFLKNHCQAQVDVEEFIDAFNCIPHVPRHVYFI